MSIIFPQFQLCFKIAQGECSGLGIERTRQDAFLRLEIWRDFSQSGAVSWAPTVEEGLHDLLSIYRPVSLRVSWAGLTFNASHGLLHSAACIHFVPYGPLSLLRNIMHCVSLKGIAVSLF